MEGSGVSMDIVIRLREIRRLRGFRQCDVARLSGINEKTVSSFETGSRIGSMKVEQLHKLLAVYGLTEAEFFGGVVERDAAPWELSEEETGLMKLREKLLKLPRRARNSIMEKFQLMLDAAAMGQSQ